MTDIERSVDFELVRAEDNGDGLTLDGYAAVWDSPTRIDSWEGQFEETMQRGAFKKTIREQTPVLQFDHGRHAMIGSIPIGRIDSLDEDERGLHVVARLSDNWLIEPVRSAIKDGAVNGMSFRFQVVREAWADNEGNKVRDDEVQSLLYNPGDRGPLQRTLVEVKCHELGPVVFPAYRDTTVGVRARSIAQEIEGDNNLRRELLAELARDPQKPYGDVTYADPGYQKDKKKRYPLDSEAHCKAAWSYINMPKNAAMYSSSQVASIKSKIKSAGQKYGIKFDGANAVSEDWSARDVALALLFPDTVTDDAPLEHEEHPSVVADAPLQDEHPSEETSNVKPERVLADAGYRAEYLALILKGSECYDEGS